MAVSSPQVAAASRCEGTATGVRAAETVAPAHAVETITMTVSNLERSVAFYTTVLGFEVAKEGSLSGEHFERLVGVFGASVRFARLRLGEEEIELLEFVNGRGRPIPSDSRSYDRWFQHIAIAVSDMDAAFDALREGGAKFASSSPQTLPDWNPKAGGVTAFYFKDPDGHVLEAIHFPTGKGDPRWQGATGRVFLGVDHTAIVVADTDRALAFYRDVLGMRVADESENFGVEQEHLNNVFGAHLRITTLRAEGGPGIELLEYLSPSNGREFPRDTTVQDMWHWHTTVSVTRPDAPAALRAARSPWVSAGPSRPDQKITSAIVRDPDGHAVLVRQPTGLPRGETEADANTTP